MNTTDGTASLHGWVRPGEVLLHIGLPKTGTTALQHALGGARDAMRAHGILYPGRASSQWDAVASMLELRDLDWPGHVLLQPDRGEWSALLREVRESPADWRRVISSEAFYIATDAQVDRVVRELGRVRVVMGVRPLAGYLPSLWQQRLRAGLDLTIDEWLSYLLDRDRTAEELEALRAMGLIAHRIMDRWVSRVGADNVTVVVVGDRGRGQLDVVESMLALEPGTLQLSTDREAGNPGLTAEQAAVIVRFNALVDRGSMSFVDYVDTVFMIIDALRHHGSGEETRIEFPAWAVPRVRELGSVVAGSIAASGVHVVGDLDALLPTERDVDHQQSDPDLDRGADLAAEFLYALSRSGYIRKEHGHPLAKWIPPALLPVAKRGRDRLRALRSRRSDDAHGLGIGE